MKKLLYTIITFIILIIISSCNNKPSQELINRSADLTFRLVFVESKLSQQDNKYDIIVLEEEYNSLTESNYVPQNLMIVWDSIDNCKQLILKNLYHNIDTLLSFYENNDMKMSEYTSQLVDESIVYTCLYMGKKDLNLSDRLYELKPNKK